MPKLPEPYQHLFQAVLDDCGAEAIRELVGKGVDLSYCDPNTGRTALYTAARSDRVRSIEALLHNGAAPNQRFTYHSPVDGRIEADRIALHYASSLGAAVALIRGGSDVSAADAAGMTPLMVAAFHGHVEVVRTLLASRASPTTRRRSRPA